MASYGILGFLQGAGGAGKELADKAVDNQYKVAAEERATHNEQARLKMMAALEQSQAERDQGYARENYAITRRDQIEDRDLTRADQAAAGAAERQAKDVDYARTLARDETKAANEMAIERLKLSTKSPSFDVKAGVNQATGKPEIYRMNKATGDVEWTGIAPVPKNGITVGPDGTITIGGDNQGLSSGTTRKIQEDQINDTVTLDKLSQIDKLYDKTFLQVPGKAKAGLTNAMSSLGMDVDPKSEEYAANKRAFDQLVSTEFFAFRKEITGAAGAAAELKQLEDGIINTNLSPVQFESAFKTYKDEVGRAVRIRNKLLREGLSTNDEDYAAAFDQQWKETKGVTPSKSEFEARADELEAKGVPPDKMIEMMKLEGFPVRMK
ncbi:hypothetical protein [Allohahella sp. A8]|uniref:hypothetical protein n=1 Tax=Allohahella sp. A8 TaxID=3141461 RepID=UPI003A7FA255